MDWTKPKGHSKSKVDWAGDVLISGNSNPNQSDIALEILDNWRAIHKYPLHVFKVRLKLVSEKIDPDALTVQRLKRLPSIIFKLQRRYNGKDPTMKLSQMQDIAGCRAVMSNMELVKRVYKEGYIRSDLKHKRVKEKDYISNPKNDGYRSIHLMYRYKSDKEGKKEYNGLLVELQIRTKLQHQWATAVETVDFFTRQAIKANDGHPDWMDFFKLVSSAFAIMEKTPLIPNTPTNENELYSQIKKREKELNIITIMSGWTEAIKVFESVQKDKQKSQYFLLELDIVGGKLSISSYSKGKEEKAILDYSNAEKRNKGKKEYDVVLVGVDAANDLRKAYPNYFADTKEFLEHLKRIIAKAN